MKILLVEDNTDFLSLMRSELALFSELWTVQYASTLDEAKSKVGDFRPDLIFLDLGLPDGSGVELLAFNRRQGDEIPTIIISVINEPETVLLSIKLGAVGYIQKSNFTPPSIKQAIEAYQQGHAPLSGSIAKLILETINDPFESVAAVNYSLSNRECEILEALSKGFSMKEVAELFDISPNTVPVHARNIYRKLEAHGKTEAIFIARQNGLIR